PWPDPGCTPSRHTSKHAIGNSPMPPGTRSGSLGQPVTGATLRHSCSCSLPRSYPPRILQSVDMFLVIMIPHFLVCGLTFSTNTTTGLIERGNTGGYSLRSG